MPLRQEGYFTWVRCFEGTEGFVRTEHLRLAGTKSLPGSPGDMRAFLAASNRVQAFTWNVGHAMPSKAELDTWLKPKGEGIDLLIVATQENHYMEKLSPRSIRGSKPARPSATRPSLKQRSTSSDGDDDMRDKDDHDADDAYANEAEPDTEREVSAERFRAALPWPLRLMQPRSTRASDGRRSVGASDWTTALTCGYNLCGRLEKYEDWEHMVLEQLNWDSDEKEPRWRVCRHAVLAEMRLTVYERIDRSQLHGLGRPSFSRSKSSMERFRHSLRAASFRSRSGSSFGANTIQPGEVIFSRRDRIALGMLGCSPTVLLAL